MKLQFKKNTGNCFTVTRTDGKVERNFTLSQSVNVKNNGSVIIFADATGRELRELPATHYYNIIIGATTFSTPEQCVEALAKIVNFSSGGGSPEIPEEPEEPKPEWQPDPDWWDIKAIFDEDPDTNKRFIMLLADSETETSFLQPNVGNTQAYYKTSDGATYSAGNFSHAWDGLQDKPCQEGYKTRYITVYSSDKTVTAAIANLPVLWVHFGNGAVIKNFSCGNSTQTIANAIFVATTADDSVTREAGSLQNHAFRYCASASNITIPDGITSMGDYAFTSCYSLANITLPNGLTGIGNYAFSICFSLASITIPDSVTSIGTQAFNNCTSLSSITIPDSVTSIGTQAFSSCSSLSSITIPDSVTSIGTQAFGNCSSLSSITIPDSVTSIGTQAFQSCYGLLSFNCEPGWVACANINLTQSTRLSVSSMIDFMYNLGLNTGSAVLITLGATNMAKLTSIPEGLAAIAFATSQGYTFA